MSGFVPTIAGARMATEDMKQTNRTAASASFLLRKRSQVSDQYPRDFAAVDFSISSTSGGMDGTVDMGDWLRIRNAWIDDGVQDVRQQLAHKRQNGKQQNQAHDCGIVVLANGFEEQAAHAGPGEDLLDDDRPAEHQRQFEAEHGDKRNQGVAKGVADDDLSARHTLSAGGADVVLTKHFLHVGLNETCVVGERSVSQADDRQKGMAKQVPRFAKHCEIVEAAAGHAVER